MTQTIAIIVPPIAVSVDATAVSDEEGENDVMLVQLIDILIIGDFQVTLEQQKVFLLQNTQQLKFNFLTVSSQASD